MRQSVRLFDGYTMEQSERYFKLTQDSVLLSDFARVAPRERALDLGCGVGTLGLLIMLQGGGDVDGVEIEEGACQIARDNYARCGFSQRAQIVCADYEALPEALQAQYGVCVANPPFYDAARAKSPASSALRRAHSGHPASFCRAAAKALSPGGRLYLCYLPERLDALLAALSAAEFSPKTMRFVHHRAEAPASLVLLEARRSGGEGLAVLPPLLIEQCGRKAPEYRRIYHLEHTEEGG